MINEETKSVYRNYKNTVNMTYRELFEWSKSKASKLASLNREPIMRNLRLLRKNMRKWNKRDITDANRTISFISRAKGQNKGKILYKNYSARDIALKNWGYDINKV